jgi:transcriptional regulator with XRE-family HTH domain
MNDMSAGEWLRQELSRRGISVRAATDAVGLKATQAVYAWLSDKAAPTDEAAARLAELLHVPEVEVRRRFGLWIPEGSQPAAPPYDVEELRELRTQLNAIIDKIEEIQRRG